MDAKVVNVIQSKCEEQIESTKQDIFAMNKTTENVSDQPEVQTNVMPKDIDIAKEHFHYFISSIESKIDVMHEQIIDMDSKIEHGSVHMNVMKDKLTSLQDTIDVRESKFNGQTDSTNHHIIENKIKIETVSEKIPEKLKSRHEVIDVATSTEVEQTHTRKSICNFIKGLVEISTLHGLPRLIGKGKIWKTLWGILLIGAFGASVLQSVGLFRSYFEYPVMIDVIPHSNKPAFPQITVCKSNPFKKSAVIRHPAFANMTRLDGANYGDIFNLIRKLSEQDRIQLGYATSDVLRAFAFFKGRFAEKIAISLINFRYLGNCYVINPPMGTTRIELFFNANVNTSLESPFGEKDKIGFVWLSQRGLHPHYSEKQHIVSLKPYTVIQSSFRLDVYSRLNGVYAGCQDDEELLQQRTGFNYTIKLCLEECRQTNALKKCGCVDPDVLHSYGQEVLNPNVRNCNSEAKRCFHKEYNQLTSDCQCKDLCLESIYTVQSSVEEMPKRISILDCHYFDEACDDQQDKWARQNFVNFNLRSHGSQYKEFKQQPLYPASRFMSDLGGTLGFYLGASVLTLFELIHMLSALIMFLFKRRATE